MNTRPFNRLVTYRPSFTLVELLVAISIIGIMAGLLLYSLLGAQRDALAARTRGTIQKINEIVLQKWEEYRYKPVNVQLPPVATSPIPGSSPPKYPVSPRESARLRMLVLRDTMRMEMPDRITDLIYQPSEYTVVYATNPTGTSFAATKIPRAIPNGFGMVYESLRNTVLSLKAQGHPQWSGFSLAPIPAGVLSAGSGVQRFTTETDAAWYAAVQSSELLYILIATAQYSGSSALEYFRPSEVGDPDEDGLLEFIDAWGRPISWIRWPAGYPGDLVRYADDDAMDPLKTDWRNRPAVADDAKPRTIVPLILSAGADGEFGVTFDFANPIVYATMTWPSSIWAGGASAPNYSAGPYYYPDPFFTWDYSNGVANGPASVAPYDESNAAGYRANQLGSVPTIGAEFAADNITNHDIILEP
jgi:prepilin-type N-terminal cleavage/methylation domain-containing protein